MSRKRFLLFSAQSLLGEIIEQTLAQVEGLELAGHWPIDEQILEILACTPTDLVVITDEGISHEQLSRLTAQILDRFPDLPVLHMTLKSNQVQIFCSHRLPAWRTDLIEVIQGLRWIPPGPEDGPVQNTN